MQEIAAAMAVPPTRSSSRAANGLRTTLPWKRTSPLLGWYTPVMALNMVVLPAPFGPITANT